MSTATASNRDPALGTLARVARLFVVLTAVEAVAVAAYLSVAEAGVAAPRYVAYPFLWTNAAVVAVAYTPIPRPRDRWTVGALGLAAGYFVVLSWAGGVAALGSGTGLGSVRVVPSIPGWGPTVFVTGGVVDLALVPFKVLGYAGLAALTYAALSRASRGLLGGALGLVTCVSCTGSVLAALLAGVFGGSSVAVSAAMARSYDLSTAIFLLAVGALWVGLHR